MASRDTPESQPQESRSSGCESCRADMQRLEPTEMTELRDVTKRFVDRFSYSSVTLFECPHCAAHWLDVFFEWDDESTKFNEWGHVARFAHRLTSEQRKQLSGGAPLDADEFFGGKFGSS